MCVCILRYAAADEQKLSGMTKCSAEDSIYVWVLYCKRVVVTLNNHQVFSIPFEKLCVPDIIPPGIFIIIIRCKFPTKSAKIVKTSLVPELR